jgi:DnaJ-class molecular chaperone
MMVFNTHIKKYVDTADGEEFCDKCKGKGTIPVNRIKLSYDPYRQDLVCHKCFGTGVLDWIEKAMGKRKIEGPSLSAASRLIRGM